MIGMINEAEYPPDFYLAPSFRVVSSSSGDLRLPKVVQFGPKGSKITRRFSSIFMHKEPAALIGYLNDGRKVYDGKVVENIPAPKLWEQLIIRKVIHGIEDEIPSPMERIKYVETHFPLFSDNTLTLKGMTKSNSTFSLVSDDRIASVCGSEFNGSERVCCAGEDQVDVESKPKEEENISNADDQQPGTKTVRITKIPLINFNKINSIKSTNNTQSQDQQSHLQSQQLQSAPINAYKRITSCVTKCFRRNK